MSEVQQMLIDLSKIIDSGRVAGVMFDSVADALNGVPEVYHMDAFKALIEATVKGVTERA